MSKTAPTARDTAKATAKATTGRGRKALAQIAHSPVRRVAQTDPKVHYFRTRVNGSIALVMSRCRIRLPKGSDDTKIDKEFGYLVTEHAPGLEALVGRGYPTAASRTKTRLAKLIRAEIREKNFDPNDVGDLIETDETHPEFHPDIGPPAEKTPAKASEEDAEEEGTEEGASDAEDTEEATDGDAGEEEEDAGTEEDADDAPPLEMPDFD